MAQVPKFNFQIMTQTAAEEIAHRWKYPGEYAFYDMEADPEDCGELLSPQAREAGNYYEARLEGQLAGFFCAAREGGNLDIGLGLRPDLCGQGLGRDFLEQIMACLRENQPFETLTMSVATFNQRAIRVYHACGFRDRGLSLRPSNGGECEFLDLIKE